jgi:hypothetical protein
MSERDADERRIIEMSIFASYFDLFAVELPALPEAMPLEASSPFESDVAAAGAELAAPALDASLALFQDGAEAHEAPAADWAAPSTSYRNDTVGVGYVMDPSASDWQDMVWVDPK